MENTIGNKSLFLTQYQFKHLCFEGISNSLWYLIPNITKGCQVNLGDQGVTDVLGVPPLLLKPLSSITDEDALELHKISYPEDINHSVTGGFRILACIDNNIRNFKDGTEIVFKLLPGLNTADYLRSKGYAISWMGLSVEQQIKYGWIKLIEE